MNIPEQLATISTFIFDVDGVMTDGSLLIMHNGEYLRTMNIKDGYALQLAVKKGFRVLVISGAGSVHVQQRMNYLGITEVHMGVKHKKALVQQLLTPEEINNALFMGDDMPDLELMQLVGLPACPADAAPEILSAARYISPQPGGKGCVRDVIEKVMKVQGKWGDNTQTSA
ncbi:MAG: HAD hydrolase family protein, partial [Dinghuibacter sp.]|nr:HAD hydrolase family protein [Dinghuibacter sp.]